MPETIAQNEKSIKVQIGIPEIFLNKCEGLEVTAATKLPSAAKAVLGLAAVAGTSHGLLAYAKAEWLAYASLNVLFFAFALLLWCICHAQKSNKRKDTS